MNQFIVMAMRLGIVFLIAAFAIVSFVTFVDANQFKPRIIEHAKKYTGRELTIEGDLSWKIFPLGMKARKLVLHNPPGFKQKNFAEINSAIISIKILPLFIFRIEPKGLKLYGLKINLVKSADGQNNWSDLQHPLIISMLPDKSSPTDMKKRASLKLLFSMINISNGTVSWIDEKTNQSIDAQSLEVQAKNINPSEPFDFSTTFYFSGKNPTLTGLFYLTTRVSIDPVKQLFKLDKLNLTTKFWKEQQAYITIQGDAIANFNNETLQISNLNVDMSGLQLVGNATINAMLTQPVLTGHIKVEPLDVKNWLEMMQGYPIPSLQTFKDLSAEFDFKTGTTLQSIQLSGNTKIDNLEFLKANFSHIDVKTQFQNGILELSPITADFYQGKIAGNMTVDFNPAIPQITLQEKILNVQTRPLMADLAGNQKLKLRGTANIDLKMTTQGTSVAALTENMNAILHFDFDKGALEGMDIGYLLDSAYALVSKDKATGLDTGETQFGQLTANATIRNGVLLNNDLFMSAPRFVTKGKGTINFNTQEINYELLTVENNSQTNAHSIRNIPIPIQIIGNLESPHIKIDSDAFVKNVTQQQIQNSKNLMAN